MILLTKFRDVCCCCYLDLYEGLYVCSCSLTFCIVHIKAHRLNVGCCEIYYFIFYNRVKVKSKILDREEINLVKKKIYEILELKHRKNMFIFKEKEVECLHTNYLYFNERVKVDKVAKWKCDDCEINDMIYLCLFCGYRGCSRIQYGLEGNSHSLMHFKSTNHCIVMLLQSLKQDYSAMTYCYFCNEFIKINVLKLILNVRRFPFQRYNWFETPFNLVNKTINENIPYEIELCEKNKNVYLILHFLAKLTEDYSERLEMHFRKCKVKNPLYCFYCQLSRILLQMNKNWINTSFGAICGKDLEIHLHRKLPKLMNNREISIAKLFNKIIKRIKKGEKMRLIPRFMGIRYLKVEFIYTCIACKANDREYQEKNILYMVFNPDLKDSLLKYLSNEIRRCECGDIKLTQKKIISIKAEE